MSSDLTQQGDVELLQTPDGGEMFVVGGVVEMSSGLETSAYLSLFGGNEKDDGRANNPKTWWANLDEIETAAQYRSQTQNLLQSIPAIPANLRRIEDAVRADLAWFIDYNVASSVVVVASVPGLNKVKIAIAIEAFGDETSFEFVENWKVGT